MIGSRFMAIACLGSLQKTRKFRVGRLSSIEKLMSSVLMRNTLSAAKGCKTSRCINERSSNSSLQVVRSKKQKCSPVEQEDARWATRYCSRIGRADPVLVESEARPRIARETLVGRIRHGKSHRDARAGQRKSR
jgi:hypothetical protein